jgi:hypothetical protein
MHQKERLQRIAKFNFFSDFAFDMGYVIVSIFDESMGPIIPCS